ncbi:MAG: magnesium transporter [Alphaproteobacteria bacterium]|nr:MAG: magnesium transporter [Alphaproteobacteria bacterium]
MAADVEDLKEPDVTDEAAEGPVDAYRLHPSFIREVTDALAADDAERVRSLLRSLHEADIADLLELLKGEERRKLISALGTEFNPEILSELDETVRDEIIDTLRAEDLAAAVAQLETDDALYVLEDLDEERRAEVLSNIPLQDRAALEEGFSYEEESAGRLMRRELIAVPQFWSVGQTIDYLRESEDLPEDFHEIFVVDPRFHPIGVVPLSRLMRAKRHVLIRDIMEEEQRLIPVDMDQEEVAFIFKQYNLTSAAVVDAQGRMVGVITIDDVVDVIQEEADEDILRLAGVQDGDLNESLTSVTRTRFIWLLVNLGTAVLASVVISWFDATLEQMVALAILMPIVASMGGNAGTQTMTVAVRALAMRELTATNALRVINKEVVISLINGVLLAVIIGALAAAWFSSVMLGLVLAVAMVVNMLVAGLSGVLIPITLQRLGVDPAVASSVFVTTVTDVVGFFAFLGLAAVIML